MKIGITVNNQEIEYFCARNHIVKLSFFGSVLRDDFNEKSDVDVLVEFEKGHVPGFFRLAEMEDELSALMGGRRVDIRTSEDLSRYFRKDVVENALVQYDAG
ncbi:MAG TPA: nucleotidyltransferase domain-containing protein [Spirochaetota bacterium]|jgi:predicted nucleotidyltransferase|nr:nucleotidyltransferase domain-containing protein [Spirochaetota bacterium]HPV42150.1 nucleotidyltransferase domain-containing protein [Spirochaetota bacterium]